MDPNFWSLSSDQAEKERQMVQEPIEKLQVCVELFLQAGYDILRVNKQKQAPHRMGSLIENKMSVFIVQFTKGGVQSCTK
jgi:hypothetical protein